MKRFHADGGRGLARDIDKALEVGLNHPMGPFELVDPVGLDTRLSIRTFTELGEIPAVPWRSMKAGWWDERPGAA
jgi:3-hydroxyacyl-CoA dehydrogenase